MKLFLADIIDNITNKGISKFTFNGKRWEIYETLYRGHMTPSYNLVDVEETKLSNKLKRFESLSEALEYINFKEDE